MTFARIVDLVSHHYDLDDWKIRRLTLRQLRRKVNNIPFVNPMIGEGDSVDEGGGLSHRRSPKPDDDDGLLEI